MRLGFVALLVGLTGSAHAQPVPCDDLRELNSVFFGFERAVLTVDAEERLAENLSLLLPCPDVGVLVEGYADEDEALAELRSRLRAEVVAAWYLAHGLDAHRIAARGLGEDPDSFAMGDPGPGDSRARRAASAPLPAADLPAEAMAWADAERPDPEPFEQELAEGVTLTLDWDLADASTVTLAAARLDALGRTWALPVEGLRAAWPGSGLVRGVASEGAPGVAVVWGTFSRTGVPYAVTWFAGPDGARYAEGDVCAASEAYDAALGLDLRALAEASRRGDAQAVARATEAAVVNGAERMRLAESVVDVGGSALTLDCSPLPLRHDH